MASLLSVENLQVQFQTKKGINTAVDGVSFSIEKGKILGIVGESGCGKSVTSLSIMQLVQSPQGQVVDGEIRFNNNDLGYDENHQKLEYDITKMPTKEMYKIRGKDITMIFQEPMTSLNPVFTIGYQLDEVSFIHTPSMSKADAKKHSIEMLTKVGISMPEHVYKSYPHELSGGMRQRVMIAMALAGNPKLIIADEPTTALDVTIQAQIIELMIDLQKKLGMAIIMITHDLGVIAQICDEVIVMYAGSICEKGNVDDIFYHPKHEYTKGLLRSIPTTKTMGQKLKPITGTPIDLLNMPKGCAFAPRCEQCMKICLNQKPQTLELNEHHSTNCFMAIKEAMESGELTIKEGTEND